MLLASTNSIVRKETTAMAIYHDHHIIPKHMGGTDDPENIVRVSVEKHAELHYQLWQDLGDYRDWLAWNGLKGLMSHDEILANIYRENAKRVHEYNRKNGQPFKNKTHTYKVREKLSKIHKNKPKSEAHKNKLKRPKSQEHKNKLSESKLGRKWYHNDNLKKNIMVHIIPNDEWVLGYKKYT